MRFYASSDMLIPMQWWSVHPATGSNGGYLLASITRPYGGDLDDHLGAVAPADMPLHGASREWRRQRALEVGAGVGRIGQELRVMTPDHFRG